MFFDFDFDNQRRDDRLAANLLPVIILHRLPGDLLQEFCGRRIDAGKVTVADRRFASQRREYNAGDEISAGHARMPLVSGMKHELGLLRTGAGKGKTGRNHQRVVVVPAMV